MLREGGRRSSTSEGGHRSSMREDTIHRGRELFFKGGSLSPTRGHHSSTREGGSCSSRGGELLIEEGAIRRGGSRSLRREPFVKGGSHSSTREGGRHSSRGRIPFIDKGGSHLRESFIDKGGRHSSREGGCRSSLREGAILQRRTLFIKRGRTPFVVREGGIRGSPSSTRDGVCRSSSEGGRCSSTRDGGPFFEREDDVCHRGREPFPKGGRHSSREGGSCLSTRDGDAVLHGREDAVH